MCDNLYGNVHDKIKSFEALRFSKILESIRQTRDIIFFAEINKHYLLDVKGDLWQKK